MKEETTAGEAVPDSLDGEDSELEHASKNELENAGVVGLFHVRP